MSETKLEIENVRDAVIAGTWRKLFDARRVEDGRIYAGTYSAPARATRAEMLAIAAAAVAEDDESGGTWLIKHGHSQRPTNAYEAARLSSLRWGEVVAATADAAVAEVERMQAAAVGDWFEVGRTIHIVPAADDDESEA